MFWILLSLHKLLNKELRINYVPETRNRCNFWEQAFRRYCVDPLVFDRWGYTEASRTWTTMEYINYIKCDCELF